MKQKMVIKLSAVHDEKSRAKAMKTAVGVDGVNSASLQQDKGLIEVIGDGVDAVLLTTQLRKSLKYAELVSVNPVEEKKIEEKKEEKKEEEKKKEPEAMFQYVMACPPQYLCPPYPPYEEPGCSIM